MPTSNRDTVNYRVENMNIISLTSIFSYNRLCFRQILSRPLAIPYLHKLNSYNSDHYDRIGICVCGRTISKNLIHLREKNKFLLFSRHILPILCFALFGMLLLDTSYQYL